MTKKDIFKDWIKITAKNRRSIFIIVVTSLVASLVLNFQMPKKFIATTIISQPIPLTMSGLSEHNKFAKPFGKGATNDGETGLGLNILNTGNIIQTVARKTPERSFEEIYKNTRIESSKHNHKFKISVIDRDPAIAAQIANTYPDAINITFYESFLKPQRLKKEKYENEIRKNEKKLERIEKEVQTLKSKHNIQFTVEQYKTYLLNKKAQYTDELEESQISLREAASKISLLEKELANEAHMRVSSEAMIANPFVKDLRTTLSAIQIRLEGALSIYAEKHPKVIKLKREYLMAKQHLDKEVDRILQSQTRSINPLYEKLREMLVTNLVKHKSLTIRIEELETNMEVIASKLKTLPLIDNKISLLNKQATRYEGHLKQAQYELNQLQPNLFSGQEKFKFIRKASIQNRPFFPDYYHIIISGLVAILASIVYILGSTLFSGSNLKQISDIRLLEWQKPAALLLAKELQSKKLLTTPQIYEILRIQMKESGRQFLELAIKLGYLSGLKVEKAMTILQTYHIMHGETQIHKPHP